MVRGREGHHIPVPRGRERENIEQKEGQERLRLLFSRMYTQKDVCTTGESLWEMQIG